MIYSPNNRKKLIEQLADCRIGHTATYSRFRNGASPPPDYKREAFIAECVAKTDEQLEDEMRQCNEDTKRRKQDEANEKARLESVLYGNRFNSPPAVETVPATTPADDVEPDPAETLAALFDPVPVGALEKMFTAGGKWKSWAEKASSNGLINARTERAKYNPYKAALWFLSKGITGWDLARCNRVLVNNLPARSKSDAHLLTGGID